MRSCKKILSLLAAMVMMICVTVSGFSVKATSQPYFYLKVDQLTSAITVNGTTVPAGYYKVEVKIVHNPGFATTGLSFSLTNLSPKLKTSGYPLVKTGKCDYITAQYKPANNSLAILTTPNQDGNNYVNTTGDGTLYTFYVSKNSGTSSVSVNVGALANLAGTQLVPVSSTFSGTMNSTTSYLAGDANGDNAVNSVDATAILVALQNHNTSSVHITTVQRALSSWFPNAKCADAADATQNGYINSGDSDEILEYYANYLAGVTHSGTAGTIKYYIA